MTYNEFIEIINMPSVLVIIFCVVFMSGLGLISLIDWLRK